MSSSLTKLAFAMLAILSFQAGCHRPFETLMRGVMDVDGRMVGDMNMRGEMKMKGEMSTVMKTDNTASRLVSVPVYASPSASQSTRICVLDLDGMLVNKNLNGLGSMGENPVALFREKLDVIENDPTIRAIVLRINSNGGGVTAADIMSRDLEQMLARKGVPVVACVMDVGAGAAYYVALSANHIVAHPTSIVGGVGVILNTYNLEDMMSQFGIVPIPVKQGQFVDVGNPTRPMEQSERDLLDGIAKQMHERFVSRLRERRTQTNSDQELVDGRVFTGTQAHDLGLVDQVGYIDDAIAHARRLGGMSDDSSIVMLRRDNDRAYTLLDVTPNMPSLSSVIPIKIPGLDRSALPTFLYLWQPEPMPL